MYGCGDDYLGQQSLFFNTFALSIIPEIESNVLSMKLIEFNSDIDLGVIVGFVSLVLAGIAFFKSWRLEKQQYKLNKYAIENEVNKREEKKHAKIRIISLEKPVPSNYMIVQIENIGKCEATEIEVAILSESEYYMDFAQDLPKSLKAGESREIGFHCSDNRFSIEYEVHWKDKAGQQLEKSEFRNTCRR